LRKWSARDHPAGARVGLPISKRIPGPDRANFSYLGSHDEG
jgi:hypothetical protein